MAYDLAKVTDNGNQLIAQILANKSSLSIDKIDVSDTQLSASTNIQTMTSISNVVQTIQANGYSKNSNSLIISTVLSNEGITADYKAWVFGIWGSDSTNGTSQLIAVITSTNSPDTVPAYSGTTPVELTYKFAIGFSNASNLSINMNSDSFATNDTVVHTTGDETIDGQKKFDTDPTDGAGNAYAKTVDVNQQLDKKVNATDTTNWQKTKINTDSGGTTLNLSVANNDNLSTTLDALSAGIYTIYCQTGVTNNPSPNSVRGLFHKTDSNYGTGYLVDWFGNMWSVYLDKNNGSHDYIKCSDDSRVVHTTDTSNWQKQAMFNPENFQIDSTSSTIDFATLLRSNYNKGGIIYIRENDGPSYASIIDAVVICEGNSWWYAYGVTIDGYFVHRKITATYDSGWVINADDSKVAHLSGANNFDTVPTVNNNPLLLASSLPSDLARTGQAQTFTAQQTYSIAPVINDASTDKGDNQAATMADLKSVENSAWHQLDSSKVTGGAIINSLVLYKIDEPNKKIYLSFAILQNQDSSASADLVYLDFSGVVNKITAASGQYSPMINNEISVISYSSDNKKVVLDSYGSYFMTNLLDGNEDQNYKMPTISYDLLIE
ncbi:hypothetical protein G8J22_02359 [Lentilactobacillus hilgardii]|uniref:hypothetical protein n=1 Tax=Lentilactobacillus hilgardii TaxID=1588 RepID=UPI00019C5E11|nr:hypothetical protein [Lentilactobacillus hilgardii]EEI19574.1 hypothetical protein HMPREF0497_1645 [Lentilactobacillus buchneri ATCC 11577]QIR10351.1 hypothetical protein G8J22_02359 [Lentilactobacillus hilgardii]